MMKKWVVSEPKRARVNPKENFLNDELVHN